MGSRALFMLTNLCCSATPREIFVNFGKSKFPVVKTGRLIQENISSSKKQQTTRRNYSTTQKPSLERPDVARLAETARISLTPDEVEEFAPKIRQVVDWFGQLQAVDLHSIEPAIRADTESGNLRDDLPETFESREAIISAMPSYEEPYIKVPKVLNKE